MNIEEHINNLKKYIEEDFAFREPIKNMSDFDRYCWNYCKDIETLLTAYEKEKEKREIAEENHKVLSLDLGKALKELGLYEDTIIADELVLEINKRFVSKNKIKPIQIIDLDGKIHNVYKIEEE